MEQRNAKLQHVHARQQLLLSNRHNRKLHDVVASQHRQIKLVANAPMWERFVNPQLPQNCPQNCTMYARDTGFGIARSAALMRCHLP